MTYYPLLFIMSIGLIFFISSTPTFENNTSNVMRNHMVWTFFIASMALSLAPRVISNELSPYVNSSIFITASIFIVMSLLVYGFPRFFEETYSVMKTTLLLALIVVIIMELINLYLGDVESLISRHRKLSYVVIVIFSLYISYDTQELLMLADKCRNYPNYPKVSVSFFLDVINIFARILFLQGSR